jgi:hypothetical protein
VRIRHYGIVGNDRRKRDIEAARAIFKRRRRAMELQPQSVADPPSQTVSGITSLFQKNSCGNGQQTASAHPSV